MIKVSVQVCSGSVSFKAAVWADGIEKALSLARTRYPGTEVRVIFPIEPESFFVTETVSSSRVVRPEMPKEAAG
jgi:hypothetical protein